MREADEQYTTPMNIDQEKDKGRSGNIKASNDTETKLNEELDVETEEQRKKLEITNMNIKMTAAATLGSASLKSKLTAEREEKEVQKLVNEVIEVQLRKLELKMKHFEELEAILEREREQLETAKQQLYADQLAFLATRFTPQPIVQTQLKPSMNSSNMAMNTFLQH